MALRPDPESILAADGGTLELAVGGDPAHRTGHFALGVEAKPSMPGGSCCKATAPASRKQLHGRKGGRSNSFRDPAGNSVEQVTPEVWGVPRGW
jgi:hypothetical protein